MLIGFQNMFARYLYALSRAGVLPARLGTVTAKSGTPATAALCVGVLIAVVVAGFGMAGADPITVTFSWLLSLGTVALIVILILTSIAIIAFFLRNKLETNLWTTKIAPVLSVASFGSVAYIAITNYDVLLGGQGGAAQWLLLLIPAVSVAGFAWATLHPAVDYEAELV
jgi:amino acid transporter